MTVRPLKLPRKDLVRDRLRDDIVHGRLKPGEVLRDLELAARYGVSTSPVREAIADLVNERLIESASHSLKRVAPLERKRSLEFFDVFRVLAVHGYREGAGRLDAAGLDAMARALEASRDGRPSFAVFGDFHDPVFVAAGNRELRRFLGLSYPWLQRLTILLLGRKLPAETALARAEATLAALREGDSTRAIGLFEEALDEFREEIEQMPDL